MIRGFRSSRIRFTVQQKPPQWKLAEVCSSLARLWSKMKTWKWQISGYAEGCQGSVFPFFFYKNYVRRTTTLLLLLYVVVKIASGNNKKNGVDQIV